MNLLFPLLMSAQGHPGSLRFCQPAPGWVEPPSEFQELHTQPCPRPTEGKRRHWKPAQKPRLPQPRRIPSPPEGLGRRLRDPPKGGSCWQRRAVRPRALWAQDRASSEPPKADPALWVRPPPNGKNAAAVAEVAGPAPGAPGCGAVGRCSAAASHLQLSQRCTSRGVDKEACCQDTGPAPPHHWADKELRDPKSGGDYYGFISQTDEEMSQRGPLPPGSIRLDVLSHRGPLLWANGSRRLWDRAHTLLKAFMIRLSSECVCPQELLFSPLLPPRRSRLPSPLPSSLRLSVVPSRHRGSHPTTGNEALTSSATCRVPGASPSGRKTVHTDGCTVYDTT